MPSRAARISAYVLCALALALVGFAAFRVDRWWDTLCFALLFFLAAQATLVMGGAVRLTLSSIVAVACYPVVGPWAAALAAVTYVRVFRFGAPRRPLVKRLYNVGQTVISTFLGGVTYVAFGGEVGSLSSHSFPYLLLPVTAATLVWHIVNTALIVAIVRLDTGLNPLRSLRRVFADSFVGSLGYSYLGLLLAVLWLGELGPLAVLVMLPPLLVARWTFAQYEAERQTHQATMGSLAQAIETKDFYTRGHGERVSRAAQMIGKELGWHGERLEALAQAGLLHDVGKIGVPTRILQKDGKLTKEEFDAIKLHPLRGVEIVGQIAFLEDARSGIMHHHEKFDGTGYPSGLKGHDIPVFGRILGVSDAFDCMTSLRSYRPARPVDEAIDELVRCSGTQFDPHLVDVFITAVRRDGWEPAPTQPAPAGANVAAFDHDDPTSPPEVEGSPTEGRA